MKEEALEALCASYEKPSMRFNALLAIYGKCDNPNRNVLQHLNKVGYTTGSLNELEYELKRILNIRDVEIANLTNAKQTNVEQSLFEKFQSGISALTTVLAFKVMVFLKLRQFYNELLENTDVKQYLSEVVENEELMLQINYCLTNGLGEDPLYVDYLKSIIFPEEVNKLFEPTSDETTGTEENPFLKAPDEVKEAIKLRDEFPFLKSQECPQVAFVLVGEKINAYEQYVAAHSELISKLVIPALEGKETPEDKENAIFELAKAAVDGFVVDQLIWDELNAYKETGKFLGVHELTKEKDEKPVNQYAEMSAVDLTKELAAAKNSMNRNKAKLDKEKDPLKAKSYKDKVDSYATKITLIQEALESKK